jgi:hypothetical protein
MTGIEFIHELPAKHPTGGNRGQGRIQLAVLELQKRPGQWAKVGEAIKHRTQAANWRSHGCETTTRKNGDGCDLYARWPK